MIWFIILLLIVAAVPFVLEAMRREPDETQAPGAFADLPSGRTHYRWIGPARGPIAVCVHGLTTPSPVWDEIAEGLGETGYRVLVYDLYGRGYSQVVGGRQDAAFFVAQLEELLADQGVEDDLTLMGYSMGGAIVTAYAAKHVHQVQRVILLASTGVEPLKPEGYDAWKLLPVLGDWLYRVVEPVRAKRQLIKPTRIGAVQRAEYDRKGFFPSVLSSRRGLITQTMEREHQLLARESIPLLAVWAEADDVIPLRNLGTLAQWNRAARQETVATAGHGLPHTHAPEVIKMIRSVLRDGLRG